MRTMPRCLVPEDGAPLFSRSAEDELPEPEDTVYVYPGIL